MFINFLFFIFFVVIIYLLFDYNFNNIYILSENELLTHLLDNNDDYYQKFNDNDFKVRNVDNLNEYKQKIKNSVCSPDNSIILKIKKAIHIADKKIKNISNKYNHSYYGIDLNKLYNIKWKLGITCNDYYENGLPHTRNDVIIFSKNQIYNDSIHSLSKTLIHEKVHIYQKLFNDDCDLYLKNKNFKKIKKITKDDNIRVNPDIDNYIYIDNKDRIYKAEYLPNPVSISDVRLYNNQQNFEHPLEYMAIEIANL
tara:strand:+ start:1383 stop:2144 length:762 start_codon:yes stop_codon:yes gene_type:complete